MNAPEQMLDNLDTLTDFEPMNETEFKICENAAAMINKSEVIPCTGCDYCSDCPKGVKISSVFSIYNKMKVNDISPEEAQKQYNAIDVKAGDCINCKKCEGHCPQGIKISDYMQGKMRNIFE